MLSRNANDLTRDFPTIVKTLAALAPQTVLDGELVALDESGKRRFDLIQHRSRSKGIMQYQVFDIPIYRSHSLQKAPLTFRREALVEALALLSGPVMISPVLDAPPEARMNAVRQFGLEGICR